jgi:hypothetical protein
MAGWHGKNKLVLKSIQRHLVAKQCWAVTIAHPGWVVVVCVWGGGGGRWLLPAVLQPEHLLGL